MTTSQIMKKVADEWEQSERSGTLTMSKKHDLAQELRKGIGKGPALSYLENVLGVSRDLALAFVSDIPAASEAPATTVQKATPEQVKLREKIDEDAEQVIKERSPQSSKLQSSIETDVAQILADNKAYKAWTQVVVDRLASSSKPLDRLYSSVIRMGKKFDLKQITSSDLQAAKEYGNGDVFTAGLDWFFNMMNEVDPLEKGETRTRIQVVIENELAAIEQERTRNA